MQSVYVMSAFKVCGVCSVQYVLCAVNIIYNLVQMFTAQRRLESKCPIFEESKMRNAKRNERKNTLCKITKKIKFGDKFKLKGETRQICLLTENGPLCVYKILLCIFIFNF